MSRITTNSQAINALADIGINIKNSSGGIREVSDIISELAGKWESLSDMEKQNTSIKVAGTNQLSRFNALMLNYDDAIKATGESLNSYNSAANEQLKYNESLEARINRLKNAWYGFAAAAGESAIYDTVVVLTSAMKSATDGSASLVSSIGLLAPAFGLVGIALASFFPKLRSTTIGIGVAAKEAYATAGANGVLARSYAGVTAGAVAAGGAIKSMLPALGSVMIIGAAFAAFGFILEKVTSAVSAHIQAEEKMQQTMQLNVDAIGKNKAGVQDLLSQYEALKSAKEGLANATDAEAKANATQAYKDLGGEQAYLDIQNKLAEVYPAIVDHVDATGQAHLKSSEAIDKETESIQKLADAEKARTRATAIEEIEKEMEKLNGGAFASLDNFIYGSLESRIKNTKQVLEAMYENGADESAIAKTEVELIQLEMQASEAAQTISGKMLEISKAFNTIEIDPTVEQQLDKFISSLDLSHLDEGQYAKVAQEFAAIGDAMQKAISDGDTDAYDKASKDLNKLADTYSKSEEDVKTFSLTLEDLVKAMETGIMPTEDGAEALDEFGNAAQKAAEKVYEFKSAAEAVAGITQEQINDTADLIWQYDLLSVQLSGLSEEELKSIQTKKNLTAEEQVLWQAMADRDSITQDLIDLYPHLFALEGTALKMTGDKVEAIKKEQHANEVLLKAYENSRDGKFNTEQQATLASAQGTKARIENLKAEILMIHKMSQAQLIAAKMANIFNGIAGLGGLAQTISLQNAMKGYQGELDNLTSSLNSSIGKIEGYNTSIAESSKSTGKNSDAKSKNAKATKDANKETEQSIYLTDKYKKKMEELTLAIEEQNALQATKSEHSKDYRKSLEKELALEQEKLKVMKEQSKSIDQQIKSGKIQQTGNVKVTNATNPNGKIYGFDGKITSRPGERADIHRGTDIAMKTGSRVDAPVSGKVIKSGEATSNKNGKAMHWSYGNMVVIQDDKGMKHILAHLDDTLVKVGDQVEAGQQVAKSGNTGRSTGAHLHYEQNTADGKVVSSLDTVNAIRSGNKTATTSSKSSSTMVSSTPETVVWNYFKNKGLSDEAVAGLMGNIKQESNFNSKAVNKSSGASGIFQWLGGRKTGLMDYAKSVGKSWTDLEVQLDYAWKEMNNKEKKSLEGLKKTNLTASQQAIEFEKNFERSGGSGNKKRASAADQYFNQYKGTNGGAGVGIDTSQQAIDQAMSELNGLNKEIYAQQENIENLKRQLIDANLAGYEYRKDNYDKTIENSENRLKKLNDTSADYRKELDSQTEALKMKKKYNQEEIVYLQDTIKNGKLTDKVIDELTVKLHELGKVNSEIDFAIKDVDLKKMESLSKLLDSINSKYEAIRTSADNSITYQRLLMQEIDTTTKKYTDGLDQVVQKMRIKQDANRQELTDLEKLIMKGELYGEALDRAMTDAQALRVSIKELQYQIQDADYEFLINIKVNSDDVVNDINFNVSRLEAIRGSYDQNSGAYKKYTEDLIVEQQKLADQRLKTRDALIEELKQRDITIEKSKELKRTIQEEHLAYLNATKAIKDYKKQTEDANKAKLSEVADKFISALKEYYQELRDEHMKAIDEMIKKETEAHELRLKQLKDEMDLFRKNVEERKRLIDRQEAERSYNMEIDDLEQEKSKTQDQIDRLALDDSYEAKSKRKKLQQQLDKIDKDIAEKRHSRDIDLQKQGLDDMLELKENEINGKIELEDEQFKATMDKLDKEKQYWEKHYNDLLNDEREFARIREDILNGHFDKIVAEFQDHIERMKLTLPDLEDTLGGTMQAVGTEIRENVIDHLQQAIDMMNEFKNTAADMGSFEDSFTTDGIFNENKPGSIGGGSSHLSKADMDVLLGKFLTDNVAKSLTGSQKEQAHTVGGKLGQSGRTQGSKIAKDMSFDAAVQGLTPADLESLRQYFAQNSSMNGGAYSNFLTGFAGGDGQSRPKWETGTENSGLSTPMRYGDMQVLMAKYMNEHLLGQTKDASMRKDLKSKADTMAADGRGSGSQISGGSFMALVGLMNDIQKNQLKSFMSTQSNIIPDTALRSNYLKFVASLNTGGMLKTTGGGVDGIGGKLFIGHNGEVVNSPVESAQLILAMDKSQLLLDTMTSLSRINPFSPIAGNINNQTTGESLEVNFYGNIGTTGQDVGKQVANQIMDTWKRRKG